MKGRSGRLVIGDAFVIVQMWTKCILEKCVLFSFTHNQYFDYFQKYGDRKT